MRSKNVLLVGGAGYIGLNIAILLYSKNYNLFMIDNLSNSKKKYIELLKSKLGIRFIFKKMDARNTTALHKLIKNQNINSIIHLAGYKNAEQSMLNPSFYYFNNVSSTVSILRAIKNTKCHNVIFSSSACVYGNPNKNPIKENAPLNFENIYGHTKLVSEEIIKFYASNQNKVKYAILRYFNPIGSDKSNLIGDSPKDASNNLMPNILTAYRKKNKKIKIYGKNYSTKDGTCVRDYIHIDDLSLGHSYALKKLEKASKSFTVNLGTGKGHSVLEVINTFNNVNNVNIRYSFDKKRKGDVPAYYADSKKANKFLRWKAKKSLKDMCKSAFNFEEIKNY